MSPNDNPYSWRRISPLRGLAPNYIWILYCSRVKCSPTTPSTPFSHGSRLNFHHLLIDNFRPFQGSLGVGMRGISRRFVTTPRRLRRGTGDGAASFLENHDVAMKYFFRQRRCWESWGKSTLEVYKNRVIEQILMKTEGILNVGYQEESITPIEARLTFSTQEVYLENPDANLKSYEHKILHSICRTNWFILAVGYIQL